MLEIPPNDKSDKTIEDSKVPNSNCVSKDLENRRNRERNDASTKEFDSSRGRSLSDIKKDFQLGDILEFVHKGLEVRILSNK